MDTKKYMDSLASQQAALSDYIAKSIAGISLPNDKAALNVGKTNFLTKSAWVYIVIGVIAFIAGLIVGSAAIWITGATAVACGVYCLIKGKQQLTAEAYTNVGTEISEGVDKTIAYVSKQWTDFVVAQNVALRTDIVASDNSNADKVKALGWITESSWLHVNTDNISSELKDADSQKSLAELKAVMPKLTDALNEDLKLACIAQTDVVKGIGGVIAPQPKPAVSAATAAAKS
ncbi:MAG: hypothetical protein K2M87_02895 [Muribaculaceae bacterium]|nr:hypothetical protein [Muribaculaceae bacterium]